MTKKIIILISLLILLAIATFIFKNSSPKDLIVVPAITSTSSNQVVLPGESIKTGGDYTIDGMAITPDVSTTTHKLYGKYSTYDVIPEDGSITKTCTAFTITSGDSAIISKYEAMVKRGNTVNRIDADGHLVLNINPLELSEEQRDLLINSNTNLSLVIRDKEQLGKDGNYCMSFIKLVSVEK